MLDHRLVEGLMEAIAPVIKSSIADSNERAIAPLLVRIAELEARALERGEKGADGRDGVDGQNGRDGADGKDGRDGKDAEPVTPEMIDEAVRRYLAAYPPAPGEKGEPGRDGVDGRDGINGNDGANGVDGLAGKDGQDGIDGKDGVGLAGAMIDRDGVLMLTLSDGTMKALGLVVGKDGKDGGPGANGRDGFSVDELDLKVANDGRTVEVRFIRDDISHLHELRFPVALYRGVHVEGQEYLHGDMVTFGGSLWHANSDTDAKPGSGPEWTLAAKRGRDGRDFRPDESRAKAEPVRLR